MNKKYSIIVSVFVSVLISLSIFWSANEDAFSLGSKDTSYLEKGMGMADEDAAYFEQQLALGRSWDEISMELWPECINPNTGYVPPSSSAPAATPQPSAPAAAPATQPSASAPSPAKTPAATQNNAPAKTYTHDYDELNNDAMDAFVYFTKDGKPDSCYVNIADSSTNNVIKGNALNALRLGNENGKISFVSENKVSYEWMFDYGWASPDDYKLDLTVSFNKIPDSEYADSYELIFKDEGSISENVVTARINTGIPDSDLYLYKENDGNYEMNYMLTSDKDGFIEFNPWDLGRYVVSKTDIIAQQEMDKEKAETEKKTEPEPTPELLDENSKNITVSADEPAITPAPTAIPTTEPVVENKPFPIIPCVIGVAVLLVIIIGIVIFKKKKNE